MDQRCDDSTSPRSFWNSLAQPSSHVYCVTALGWENFCPDLGYRPINSKKTAVNSYYTPRMPRYFNQKSLETEHNRPSRMVNQKSDSRLLQFSVGDASF